MPEGATDLVMLDYRGHLTPCRHERRGDRPVLLPPERILVELNGRFLYLERGRAGASGRRKVELVDWGGDLDALTDSEEDPSGTRTSARSRSL